MTTVTIRKAKTQLSELIERALGGEEIVTARGKEPLGKLMPLPQPKPQQARRIGGARRLVVYMADDFDAPLELCCTLTS